MLRVQNLILQRSAHEVREGETQERQRERKRARTQQPAVSHLEIRSGHIARERVAHLVVLLKKLLLSRFISSLRNRDISSSIFLISASKRSRMLENSVSITLKSPSLIGMLRLIPLSAMFPPVCVHSKVCTSFSLALPCHSTTQRGTRVFVVHGSIANNNSVLNAAHVLRSESRLRNERGLPAAL